MTVAHRNLRRLEPQAYRGLTAVHWTFSLENRAVGWLTEEFHNHFREVLTHMGLRYGCVVPIYCLMPDHHHIIMLGLKENADLYLAARFLRKQTAKALFPAQYQKQAYDHVLDKQELDRGVFEEACFYVLENPVRGKLCQRSKDYPFSGSLVPGYPDLRIHEDGYWELFWKICHRLTTAATRL